MESDHTIVVIRAIKTFCVFFPPLPSLSLDNCISENVAPVFQSVIGNCQKCGTGFPSSLFGTLLFFFYFIFFGGDPFNVIPLSLISAFQNLRLNDWTFSKHSTMRELHTGSLPLRMQNGEHELLILLELPLHLQGLLSAFFCM